MAQFNKLGFRPEYEVNFDATVARADGTGRGAPLWLLDPASQHGARPATSLPESGHLVFQVVAGANGWLGAARRGLTDFDGAWACPHPFDLCMVAGGAAYLIPIDQPARSRVLISAMVEDVAGHGGSGVLVLATPYELTLLDGDGFRWRSRRLGADGLRIVEVDANGITCTARVGDETHETLRVSAANGTLLEGSELAGVWGGSTYWHRDGG